MWLSTSMPISAEEQLGQGARRDPGRRLAGRGPLEHVAGVVEAVLEHPGQVGVARAGAGSAPWTGRPGAGDISSSHFGHSVLAISMATGEPSVRPCRMPPSRLTSSASKRIRGPRPKPSRRRAELALDVLGRHRQAGRQPFHDDDQGAAVGLPGGQEAQHPRQI